MGWLEFVASLLQFGLTVFGLFLGERVKRKEAEDKNEKYEIEFDKMVLASLERWREDRKRRSAKARDLDRQMEDDKNKP